MIHAGVIRTGSAYTSGVCGAYCSSSMSRLRNTTLPGVTATSLPTSNCSVPAGRAPLTARCASSSQCFSPRSEEHTSELQSQSNLVCRLLLEKKKQRPLSESDSVTIEVSVQLAPGLNVLPSPDI